MTSFSVPDQFTFIKYMGVWGRKCITKKPFRCIIDKKIKNAYNLNQIQIDDFGKDKGQYYLKIDKSKKYTAWLVQEIMKYKEDIFIYTQNYYRAFMREKEISDYPVFFIKD